jgi:hypothetical protein
MKATGRQSTYEEVDVSIGHLVGVCILKVDGQEPPISGGEITLDFLKLVATP